MSPPSDWQIVDKKDAEDSSTAVSAGADAAADAASGDVRPVLTVPLRGASGAPLSMKVAVGQSGVEVLSALESDCLAVAVHLDVYYDGRGPNEHGERLGHNDTLDASRITDKTIVQVVEGKYTARTARKHLGLFVANYLLSPYQEGRAVVPPVAGMPFVDPLVLGALGKDKMPRESLGCVADVFALEGAPERPVAAWALAPAAEQLAEPATLEAFFPAQAGASTPGALPVVRLSAFNPPPRPRALDGDLFYIEVAMPNGAATRHVTAHRTGFFENHSTADAFNPRPTGLRAHDLYQLVCKMSPAFRKIAPTLRQTVTDTLVRAETAPNETVAGDWLSKGVWTKPLSSHQADVSRADAIQTALAEEGQQSMPRDINEEVIAVHALPSTTMDELRVKDMHQVRITNEIEAVVLEGVRGIVEGSIEPLNPDDDPLRLVYVHRNIFFSSSSWEPHWTIEDGRIATVNRKLIGQEARGMTALGGNQTGIVVVPTMAVDYCGRRLTAQTIPPGILSRINTDNVRYGSLDGGQTIIHAGVEPVDCDPVAMAKTAAEELAKTAGADGLVDAQLMAQATDTSLIVAGLDEARLASTVEKLFRAVMVGTTPAVDGEGTKTSFAGPASVKVLAAGDGRIYLLDGGRIMPRDVNYPGGEHVDKVIRPELLTLYLQREASRISKEAREALADDADEDARDAAATAAVEAYAEAFAFDVNVQTSATSAIDPLASKDASVTAYGKTEEERLQVFATFLVDQAIPALVRDLTQVVSGQVLDEAALVGFMHQVGINVRYAGRVLAFVQEKRAEKQAELSKLIDEQKAAKEAMDKKVDEIVEAVDGVQKRIQTSIHEKRTAEIKAQVEKARKMQEAAAAGQTIEEKEEEKKEEKTEEEKTEEEGEKDEEKEAEDQLIAAGASVEDRDAYLALQKDLETAIGDFAGRGQKLEIATEHVAAFGVLETSLTRVIVTRAIKHVFNAELAAADVDQLTTVAASLLSRAFGDGTGADAAALWTAVKADMDQHFGHAATAIDVSTLAARKAFIGIPVLRGVCLNTGLVIRARGYGLGTAAAPFKPKDILDIVATVKSARTTPASVGDMMNAAETVGNRVGREQSLEFYLTAIATAHSIGYELCNEVVTAHAECAKAYAARGDVHKAVMHQFRALVTSERTRGADSHATLYQYFVLGSYLHSAGFKDAGDRFLERAFYLTRLMGDKYTTTFELLVLMATHALEAKNDKLAIALYKRALTVVEEARGSTTLMLPRVRQQIAGLLFKNNKLEEAIAMQKETVKEMSVYQGRFMQGHDSAVNTLASFEAALEAKTNPAKAAELKAAAAAAKQASTPDELAAAKKKQLLNRKKRLARKKAQKAGRS